MGSGCGLCEVAGRGASCFGRGALRHEGGGGRVCDGGGALCWVLLPPGPGRLGPIVVEDVPGGRPCAAVVAPGFGLALGLAVGCGRGAPTGWGGCLAAVLGFGCIAGAVLVGAWALAAVGLLAVGTGLGARLGGFPRGFGGGVLDEDVVVVVDEVVVVVEVVESEAEKRAVGDGGGPWAFGGRRRMRGPASSEKEGAGSGMGCVRALSLVTCACWCWCGGVVSAVRARGLPGGCPYLFQDVRVRLLEVVEGAEEAALDAGHVLLREVGVVLGGGVGARQQQRHEAGCHHVQAEL